MASILRFDNWQNSDGTSIATTDASGNISFAGSLGATGGVGKILQVVSATTATTTTTSSTSYVDTALSATITPTAATSTIVIMTSASYLQNLNNSNISTLKIYRGDTATGTALGTSSHAHVYSISNTRHDMPASIVFTDSPATTSATTYTVGIRTNNFSAAQVGGQQSMVLMEVSA